MITFVRKQAWADVIGASASALCIIHCLLTPILLTAVVVSKPGPEGSTATLGLIWGALDFIFLTISIWAVYRTASNTTAPLVRRLIWPSWALLAMGLLLEKCGISAGGWAMYLGSFSLVVMHLINHFYCRSCSIEK